MKPIYIDIIVVAVIFFCAVRSYKLGFIRSSLSFLPMLAALAASYFIAPVCGKMFRQTPLFSAMKQSISNSMNLEALIGNTAANGQARAIEQIKIPEFFKNALLENNNPVAYDILQADALQDYIAGFLANISVNIISVLLVGTITFVVFKLFLNALNLVFKLPVLSFFNRLCGLTIGTVQGISIIWIVCIILTFFYFNPKFSQFFALMEQSYVAKMFYDNNILLLLIIKIFA